MSGLKSFLLSVTLLCTTFSSFAEGTFADGTPYKGSWIKGQIAHPSMALGVGQYFVYKPKVVKRKSMMVMLHGCAYSSTPAEDFVRSSGMIDQAERDGFVIILPQQTEKMNTGRCWNWFLTPNYSYRADLFPLLPANEPGLVLQMIDAVSVLNNLDTNRVYVMGMSAGGSLAVNLASCYPERFKAFGIHSGNQYRAAAPLAFKLENYTDVKTFQKNLIEVILHPDDDHMDTIQNSSDMALLCAGAAAKPVRAVLFHGDKDPMPSGHSDRLLAQLKLTNDLFDNRRQDNSTAYNKAVNQMNGAEPGKYDYQVTEYKNKKGEAILTQYIVKEMGHAWSGGDNRWQFNDPEGPSATNIMMDFFKKNGF